MVTSKIHTLRISPYRSSWSARYLRLRTIHRGIKLQRFFRALRGIPWKCCCHASRFRLHQRYFLKLDSVTILCLEFFTFTSWFGLVGKVFHFGNIHKFDFATRERRSDVSQLGFIHQSHSSTFILIFYFEDFNFFILKILIFLFWRF